MGGALGELRRLFGRERLHHLGGAAEDHRVVREFLALGDQRAGADDAVAADLRAVEHDGADADQRAVADGAAVQHALVADGDVLADDQRDALVGVQHRVVLHVAAAADAALATLTIEATCS